MEPSREHLLSKLAWMSAPLALYLFVLQRLWVDAPVWDDYGTVLDSVMRMMDAPSAKDWLAVVVAQHNEHRIATVRLISRGVAALFGRIDFRVLVLVGNLWFVGVFLLIWAEFRDAVPAPLFAAAAFLMFQWSYYEAGIWTSGGLPNMGSVFFCFACLFFATRGRWPAAAASILFAILAIGSSANGLFPLPIAATACAVQGKRERAWLFGAASLGLWALYFWGYRSPAAHPSPMLALSSPLATAQLFLIVIGGIIPGRWAPILAGLSILAFLAWLFRKGFGKAHPTATLWIVFVLVSAAAAAAGRVGFGVFHASRYAIYSTCLLVLAFLGVYEATRPWSRPKIAFAIVGAAAASFAISWMSWRDALLFSLNGHLLAKAVPAAPDPSLARYFGMYFPNPAGSAQILLAAESHGLYVPKEQPVYPSSLRLTAAIAGSTHIGGSIDEVSVAGSRVTASGWTEIPATVPGRTFSVFPSEGIALAMKVVTTDRSDAARALRDSRLVFSGFRLELDYPSEEMARKIPESLCVAVEAPGHSASVLSRTKVSCPPLPARGTS